MIKILSEYVQLLKQKENRSIGQQKHLDETLELLKLLIREQYMSGVGRMLFKI
jgi:hypothetical protein